MKINPKPSTTLSALGSIGPVPRSVNSGNSTAPTTIIPATRQAARNPKKITTRRPISAIESVRHCHRAQRLAFARRQFFGLRFQLAASGENVAAARRAHRRGVAGVEDVLGEFFDLVPIRTLVTRARPRVERNQVDFRGNPLEQFYEQFGIIE